ncbi:MAG: hypothetical protein WCV91_00885 [Candidatus Margulisiibacteriota bacterium]
MKIDQNLGKLDLGQSSQKNGLSLENIGDRVHKAISGINLNESSQTKNITPQTNNLADPNDVRRQIAGINPQPMPGLLYNSVV